MCYVSPLHFRQKLVRSVPPRHTTSCIEVSRLFVQRVVASARVQQSVKSLQRSAFVQRFCAMCNAPSLCMHAPCSEKSLHVAHKECGAMIRLNMQWSEESLYTCAVWSEECYTCPSPRTEWSEESLECTCQRRLAIYIYIYIYVCVCNTLHAFLHSFHTAEGNGFNHAMSSFHQHLQT